MCTCCHWRLESAQTSLRHLLNSGVLDMPPRYDTYTCLQRGNKPFERLSLLGVVVEWFWYYAFGRPRRGLYSLEPSDVNEIEL